MKNTKRYLLIIITGILFGCKYPMPDIPHASAGKTHNYEDTSRFYDSMFSGGEANTALLTLFLRQMPKGGDLHHHYTGTIYAETYLDWVKSKNWYIDKCTLEIVKTKKPGKCASQTVEQIMSDGVLYTKLLTLWSDKDYSNHFHIQPPPDTQFFNTFGYFGPISDEYMNIGLKIIKQRALKENVQYIESMLSRVGIKSKNIFNADRQNKYNRRLRNAKSQKDTDRILTEITSKLGKNNIFRLGINNFIAKIEKSHTGIDDKHFMMRYQTYATRVTDPLQVYTDLLSGYMAAKESALIVGVNIVAPENNHVALSDYTLHMRMFNFLYRKYPDIQRSLHAGELTLGMVRPKDLTFHIWQARNIAHAQRIGHGIDIPHEQDPTKLLKNLKENTAIEINLTSNEFILGVKKNEHPYLIYSAYGVPLVISTDDSGVSRNNLTREYLLLASRYRPKYSRIKEYVYNSIKYSFLDNGQKNRLKSSIDKQFAVFEKKMAGLYKTMTQTAR